MSVLSRPFIYNDLLRERETRDEWLELIEGEIVVTPSPSPLDQILIHRLSVLLDPAIVAAGRGQVMVAPLDVYLEDDNVLQPDVIVLLHDRMDLLGSTNIESAPSLAIEVLSPSTRGRDQGIKRNLYARFAVPEYWIVDPVARSVTIFSDPRDGRYAQESKVFDGAVSATIPGLSIDLTALFAPVPGAKFSGTDAGTVS